MVNHVDFQSLQRPSPFPIANFTPPRPQIQYTTLLLAFNVEYVVYISPDSYFCSSYTTKNQKTNIQFQNISKESAKSYSKSVQIK